jgi:putative FmdB family regulatory protein
MPTYQYACVNPDCGNEFELVQSFTDPAASECPICGQPVRKRFGSVGVVFKGSGFYRTDSRAESKSTANGSKKNDKAPAKTDSASSTSSSSSATNGASAAPAAPASGSSGRVAASA